MLRTDGLSVTYGGVRAVDGVDLAVRRGSLVGLIGPNGAGKTSLVDAVAGFTPASGTVLLDGAPISNLNAHSRARKGLARTWQTIELFDDLTVGENIAVATTQRSVLGSLRELVTKPKSDREAAGTALARFGLEDHADRMPSALAEGQRKRVGIARALAGRPKLLCLDEPAAGLNTQESGLLGRQLREIIETDDVSVLLIDHDMGLVLGISDYVYVLDFGKIIAQGTPDVVRRDPKVVTAYLGVSSEKKVGG